MRNWVRIPGMVCLILTSTSVPALGHPKLIKSQPAKGAILKKAPTNVQLWFHEELDTKLSGFTVLNQQNERVDNGDGKVNLNDVDRKMMEGSVKSLPPGGYTVHWKAAGEDDKVVVEGTFTFRVQP